MAESSAKRRRVNNCGGGGGEVPPLLRGDGRYFSDAVWNALRDYDEDMIQRITDEYTVNAQNGDGTTLLMWAVWYGYVASVRFLIERGAAVNIQNNLKDTALHYVCNCNAYVRNDEFEEFLVLLLRAGADPTIKDLDGETPRDWTRATDA